MPAEPRKLFTLRIFAARAAAELERLQFEQQLRESEDQYRDLFEEAPIGYVKEDLESHSLTANRAALRILGLKPEEVAGTVGKSFIPDTPDAQRRVREAFASVGRGTETSGVVLELRRKDDGRPVWVQWWSRPEPNGSIRSRAEGDKSIAASGPWSRRCPVLSSASPSSAWRRSPPYFDCND
jgi:PAS domain S-box-containing protein